MEYKIHYYQKLILKKLTLSNSLKFNEIMIDGLESEHTNYHIKKLVSSGLILKSTDGYSLSDLGKDYIGRTDDDVITIEKQPKVGVVLKGMRVNSNGETEHLLNKRLKQPYYGKVGALTGKLRFGETILETAQRELFEETGLSAKNFVLASIYRKIRKNEKDEFVQDSLFFIYVVSDFEGTLITSTELQENFWVTKEQALQMDCYDDMTFYEEIPKSSEINITESIALASGF